MQKIFVRLLLGAAALLNLQGAHAQAWPSKPVKWILSQPAGSGPDVISRYVAEHLARVLGQPIVIENRPGGQNVIGAQAAAKSAPDGYIFYYGTTAAIVTNVYTFKSLPYDPRKDFIPVAMVGRSPFVIAASPAANVRTLGDALMPPGDDDDARKKIGNLVDYIETIRVGAHPGPGRVPFVLSYFWGLAERRTWPVAWASGVSFVEFLIGRRAARRIGTLSLDTKIQ